MSIEYPVELQFFLIDTLCEVFYWKKALRRFMSTMNLPKPLFEVFLNNLRYETKRVALNQLFEELINMPHNTSDDVLFRITSTLLDWRNFTAASDEVAAKQLILEFQIAFNKYNLTKPSNEHIVENNLHDSRVKQEQLLDRYYDLVQLDNPQKRGLLFEELLTDVFSFENIKAEGAFKLAGEQIDGVFVLNDNHYLLESKWQKSRVQPKDISWFRVKVERKLSGTRGLFISINGFTDEAVRTANDSRVVILMDGDDLHQILILTNDIRLSDLLQHKISVFAKSGNSFATARDFMNN